MTWLEKVNPVIDFKKKTITFRNKKTKFHVESTSNQLLTGARAVLLPEEYKEFQDVFDPVEAKELPKHTKHDCALNLVSDNVKLPAPRMYKLTIQERQEL